MGDFRNMHNFTDFEDVNPEDFFAAGVFILAKAEEQNFETIGASQACALVNGLNECIHVFSNPQ
jgi:hypothetical protein